MKIRFQLEKPRRRWKSYNWYSNYIWPKLKRCVSEQGAEKGCCEIGQWVFMFHRKCRTSWQLGSRNSAVSVVTGLWVGRGKIMVRFPAGPKITFSRRDQRHVWVPRSFMYKAYRKCEADHLQSSRSYLKNTWSHTTISPYTLMSFIGKITSSPL